MKALVFWCVFKRGPELSYDTKFESDESTVGKGDFPQKEKVLDEKVNHCECFRSIAFN